MPKQEAAEIEFTYIKPQFRFKMLDAAMTACLNSKGSLQFYVSSILKSRTTYERISSVVNLLNVCVPGTAKRIHRTLYRPDKLPLILGMEVTLLDFGSGATVFLLQSQESKQVLKVFRRSLGKSMADLLLLANQYKAKYEMILRWYNVDHCLIPSSHFMILHSPLQRQPAVALIQPYISGLKKDIFRDFSDAELISLLQSNERLKSQFISFADQTRYSYAREQKCIDFLGRENVAIVEEDGTQNLMILDNGIFDIKDIQRRYPKKIIQIEEYLARLSRLIQVLEPAGSAETENLSSENLHYIEYPQTL